MPPETDNPIVPIVIGPTAVGKTEMVIRALDGLDAEIISADSRQIYKHMDIGTAKPTHQQRKKVKHHLIDFVDPEEPVDAQRYGRMARAAITNIFQKGKMPVVVGGSGLYLRSLREGFFQGPAADPKLRKELIAQEHRRGEGTLHRRLSQVDPESAGRIHPNDMVRTIRALEVFTRSGRPLSQWQQHGRYQHLKFPSSLLGIFRPRAELYRRIEERVDNMVTLGLVEEVRCLLERGYSDRSIALSTVGYGEIIAYFEGQLNLEEAISLIKRNTRQYAKRQMTWFGRQDDIIWFHAGETAQLRRAILDFSRGHMVNPSEVTRRREQMRCQWSQHNTFSRR